MGCSHDQVQGSDAEDCDVVMWVKAAHMSMVVAMVTMVMSVVVVMTAMSEW